MSALRWVLLAGLVGAGLSLVFPWGQESYVHFTRGISHITFSGERQFRKMLDEEGCKIAPFWQQDPVRWAYVFLQLGAVGIATGIGVVVTWPKRNNPVPGE
jgi:hypothetical protein